MKRRRFLAISAAMGALAATPARAFALDPVEWRGTAMGAAARLTIHHEDRAEALRLLDTCLAELERLERLFSLYRADSALVRLNRDGRLDAPPLDMLALLGQVDRVWHWSHGTFDPTVQPLWRAYVRHFSQPEAQPAGPPPAMLEQLRPLIGWDKVQVSTAAIILPQPGMGLTLNGIAQGYVTDAITQMLRQGGMRHVLADMGEIRALGGRDTGQPWRVAVADKGVVLLEDRALAVSAADGTRFSPQCHHLFDPALCRSSPRQAAITIMAATATLADAVSTACAVVPHLTTEVTDSLDCVVL